MIKVYREIAMAIAPYALLAGAALDDVAFNYYHGKSWIEGPIMPNTWDRIPMQNLQGAMVRAAKKKELSFSLVVTRECSWEPGRERDITISIYDKVGDYTLTFGNMGLEGLLAKDADLSEVGIEYRDDPCYGGKVSRLRVA